VFEDMATAAGVTFGALFAIVDPLGNVPIFHALTSRMTEEQRRGEARKAALATFALLVAFLFVGRFVLDFFGITLAALEIAGGLVVGYAGWEMVTKGLVEPDEDDHPASVWMSPLTMPLLAGPGALGVTLGLATRHETAHHYVGTVIGIGAVALSALVLMLHGGRPLRRLGHGGMDGLVRIFGLIVLAIAVELIAHGVTAQDL
jgi:multiple antibiotic resistance protein